MNSLWKLRLIWDLNKDNKLELLNTNQKMEKSPLKYTTRKTNYLKPHFLELVLLSFLKLKQSPDKFLSLPMENPSWQYLFLRDEKGPNSQSSDCLNINSFINQ